ncbi:hypothetical protein OC846_001112 [Tilletia horrida]|uniref:Uncharacterized protein n=1 Tax=Tilletia horrida TaxID=155126 RepID=A0AAN6GTX5_9BASI|nr:hypothetical protein OC846_001112 [Tilletia horrida]
MSLPSFIPPNPLVRGERTYTFGRARVLTAGADAFANPTAAATTVPLRSEHLRKVFDILQLSLLRGDGPRAARALRILIRAKEWRHSDLWRYGLAVAGLLGRDAFLSTSRARQYQGSDQDEKLRRLSEEAATLRRLAYLRGLYRAKQAFRADLLVQIVYELIELKRYEEAMRELEFVLDTHPFRNSPTLHLLAGVLTLDSGLHTISTQGGARADISDLPHGVKRVAAHHFERSLSAARRDESEIQHSIESRIEGQRRRDEQHHARRQDLLRKELEKSQQALDRRTDLLLEPAEFARFVEGNKARRKQAALWRRDPGMTRLPSRKKTAQRYQGPASWTAREAHSRLIPESDVDRDEDCVDQLSAVSDDDEEHQIAPSGSAQAEPRTAGDNPDLDDDVHMDENDGDEEDVEQQVADALHALDPTETAHAEGETEDEAEAETYRARQPSVFAVASELISGWNRTEGADGPRIWEAEAAQMYLRQLRSESSND